MTANPPSTLRLWAAADGDEPLRTAAIAWLGEYAYDSIGTEIAFRTAASTPGWTFGVVLGGGEVRVATAVSPSGIWYLQAKTAADAAVAVSAIAASELQPVKILTSGTLKAAIRPLLTQRWSVPRDHDQLAMHCTRAPPLPGAGRWAVPADVPQLEEYQRLYNEERRTAGGPSWSALIARWQIAVLDDGNGGLISVVRRSGDTARYAAIGGTYTFRPWRGQGHAARLTAFIVRELLMEGRAVHLIVDNDNEPAIRTYRSVGFEFIGRSYMAYLATTTQTAVPSKADL